MRRTPRLVTLGGTLGLAMWLAAALVVAQSLPRLPKDFNFPQSADSPGVVTFSHETHLAVQARPDCIACHPKLFRTLESGVTRDGQPVVHARMEKKAQCGACHNGEAASGLDDCTHCHRM
jgi:c(7)-type cytochrome triheme protein